MSIYVCDISAAQFWTSGAFNPADFPYLCARSIEHAGIRKKDIQLLHDSCVKKGAFIEMPLHAYIAKNQRRTPSAFLIPHTYSNAFPLGSFIEFMPEIYIATPEFCFLQLSNKLSFIQLIKLGFELCATYREGIPKDEKLQHAKPLTTIEELDGFLSRCQGLAGISKAKRALSYVLPNADSPMETKMAMLLTLPNSLGGSAIGNVELNSPVRLSKEAQKLCGKTILKPDLMLLEEKIIVEYDSDAFHTGATRIASDSKRRTALQHDGYTVLTLTRTELNSLESIDTISKTIYQLENKRYRITLDNFNERRKSLYQEIKPCYLLWNHR